MQNNIVTWTPGMSLESVERQVILAAFRHYRGNKTATAQSLGIAIRTLDNKLAQYEGDDKKEKLAHELNAQRGQDFLARQRGFTTSVDGAVIPIEGGQARVYSGPPRGAEKSESNGESAEAGLSMESASEAPAQPSVPLPVGAEVQSVSSKHAARNRSERRR